MRFQLDFKSGKAVYQQLVDQVKIAAAAGAIQPGEALPGIRPLAEDLRVNRNTVAKAYAELEHQGIIETSAGRGCFIKDQGSSPFRKDVRRKLLADSLDTVVVHAHHLRISREEFLQLAEDRFDALQAKRQRFDAIEEEKRARAATSNQP